MCNTGGLKLPRPLGWRAPGHIWVPSPLAAVEVSSWWSTLAATTIRVVVASGRIPTMVSVGAWWRRRRRPAAVARARPGTPAIRLPPTHVDVGDDGGGVVRVTLPLWSKLAQDPYQDGRRAAAQHVLCPGVDRISVKEIAYLCIGHP